MSTEDSDKDTSYTGRIAVAWTLVTVPLVYGLAETVRRAANLFTG